MGQDGLFQGSQPEAPKLEPTVPFYGNGVWVGEIRAVLWALRWKMQGCFQTKSGMLPSGESSSASHSPVMASVPHCLHPIPSPCEAVGLL